MYKKLWRRLSGADAAEKARERIEQSMHEHFEQSLRPIFQEYREAIPQSIAEAMADVIAQEVQSRLVEYWNAGHRAGLHEGWSAAKAGEVFPAHDGPVRAEARRIFESRHSGHAPMTRAELDDALKARLDGIGQKALERVWKAMRQEFPEKTKGPGRPKK